MASVCSPAETPQLPAPSALAGGKSKGTGVCCGSAKLPFEVGGGEGEGRGAFVSSGLGTDAFASRASVGKEGLCRQQESSVPLAAGAAAGSCARAESTSDDEAHRSETIKDNSVSLQAQSLHLPIHQII